MALKRLFTDEQLPDVFRQLIKYYQEHMDDFPKTNNIQELRHYLIETHLQYGICHCAEKIASVFITKVSAVKRRMNYLGGYWYIPAWSCDTRDEVIKSLQVRIRMMQECIDEINS
jgi:hypothetical protein